jgi:hypothetical protein
LCVFILYPFPAFATTERERASGAAGESTVTVAAVTASGAPKNELAAKEMVALAGLLPAAAGRDWSGRARRARESDMAMASSSSFASVAECELKGIT